MQTYAIVRCKIFYCTDAGDQNLKAEVKFEPENASVVLSFPSALQVTIPVQVPIISKSVDDDGENYIMVLLDFREIK